MRTTKVPLVSDPRAHKAGTLATEMEWRTSLNRVEKKKKGNGLLCLRKCPTRTLCQWLLSQKLFLTMSELFSAEYVKKAFNL